MGVDNDKRKGNSIRGKGIVGNDPVVVTGNSRVGNLGHIVGVRVVNMSVAPRTIRPVRHWAIDPRREGAVVRSAVSAAS